MRTLLLSLSVILFALFTWSIAIGFLSLPDRTSPNPDFIPLWFACSRYTNSDGSPTICGQQNNYVLANWPRICRVVDMRGSMCIEWYSESEISRKYECAYRNQCF